MKAPDPHHLSPEVTLISHISLAERNHRATATAREAGICKETHGFAELCGIDVTDMYDRPQSVQFSSVAQSCLTLCDPMNHSTPGLPVHHQLPEFTQTHIHELLMPSSHLILCRPLFLLPPIPPSITVFSDESTLHMRWPKY